MPTPTRDLGHLLDLMEALRDPATGCPWDLEQNFATIAPYTIEEAFEVVEAITRGDLDDLKDELGDLLLQVVFHAQLARELGKFDFGDVVESITAKLIRRHPHLFGDAGHLSADEVKALWDGIKRSEASKRDAHRASGDAEGVGPRGALSGVPAGLPAMIRAAKLSRKAAAVGFDWGTVEQVLEKIDEEIREVREAVDGGLVDEIEGEIGDLLFAVVNLARHAKVDPETALRRTNEKFERRFRSMEETLARTNDVPNAVGLARLEELWARAKQDEVRRTDARPSPIRGVAREDGA